MNKLNGKIVDIESSPHMSMVDIDVEGDIFSSIVLETPSSSDYLKTATLITLLFKETEVSLAKNLTGEISLRNRFGALVKNIERSRILTKVTLDYKNTPIISIISTRSADRLALKLGDRVEWLVKTNEVSLLKEKTQ